MTRQENVRRLLWAAMATRKRRRHIRAGEFQRVVAACAALPLAALFPALIRAVEVWEARA